MLVVVVLVVVVVVVVVVVEFNAANIPINLYSTQSIYSTLFYIHHSLIINIEMHTLLNNIFIEVKSIR